MFHLTDENLDKIREWKTEQDLKVAKKQDRAVPYYGASGGAYTYSFTPTTLGCVVKVRNCITEEELDLTDYDAW